MKTIFTPILPISGILALGSIMASLTSCKSTSNETPGSSLESNAGAETPLVECKISKAQRTVKIFASPYLETDHDLSARFVIYAQNAKVYESGGIFAYAGLYDHSDIPTETKDKLRANLKKSQWYFITRENNGGFEIALQDTGAMWMDDNAAGFASNTGRIEIRDLGHHAQRALTLNDFLEGCKYDGGKYDVRNFNSSRVANTLKFKENHP